MGLGQRLQHAWNAFMNKDPTTYQASGPGYSYRPDRVRLTRGNERSIITAIYNRIAADCADITIEHVQLDADDRFAFVIESGLNSCLNLSANLDQTGRAFIQDIVISMLDEGVVAVVPTDTSENPRNTESYDILSMRVGKILEWFPSAVRVDLYNERTGRHEQLILPKNGVAIIENPFYAVMNEPNSTLQRLIRKLNLLDMIDEKNSSGKLDLVIQLPYTIKTDSRRAIAEQRRNDLEKQLTGSKYGIGYIDSTERITQLNRPVENNLMAQVEYLTSMLYSQLTINQSILDGTADEKTMLNYNRRLVEPIVSAIVNEFKRKFLTQTARTRGHSIMFFSDPFKLVPVANLADIADKMTRNEIMTSNEVRQVIGYKPSEDPNADKLLNKNISQPGGEEEEQPEAMDEQSPDENLPESEEKIQNGY